MRTKTAALCLLATGLLAGRGTATPAAPAPPPVTPLEQLDSPMEYDPAPFEQGLRPHYRKNMPRRMGIGSLTELPLYQMELELDAIEAELIAEQDLNFRNPWQEPLRSLVLRLFANATHLRRDGRPNLRLLAVEVDGRPVAFEDVGPSCIRLALPQPLEPGQRLLLSIRYRLRIPRLPSSAAGAVGMISPNQMLDQLFGKNAQAGYGIIGHAAGVFNLGYFYPVLASRRGGSWDTGEPAGMGDMAHFDVANFQVKLVAPQPMVIVTSGVQVGSRPLGSGGGAGRETFVVGTALRHLAIQASTRYETHQRRLGDIDVRVTLTSGHAGSAEKLLEYAVASLDAYQKLFGPYPYPELDVVEAPLTGGAGGIEYPGLVTIAMGLCAGPTGNPNADLLGSLLAQTQTPEFVVAHEVAHQWFHVLVGSDSNRHPFLDEALANYAAVVAFEARHGRAAAAEQVDLQLKLPYQLMRMLGGPDKAVDQPTSAFANQLQYSAIVYGKGALFFHRLRSELGRKRLFRGLRRYVARHAFREAGPDDLRQALAAASGKPKRVRALYQHWIQQRHGDEDIGRAPDGQAMQQMMGQLQNLKGFHNTKVQGLDPATMRLFQQAVRQLQGGP